MQYHILNGDVLAEKFPSAIEGHRIILREAFMDGPVSESFDQDYWALRMHFVTEAFDADAAEYWTRFGSQLVMMREIRDADDVYLWFEDDLFCQVNMWMAVNYILLHRRPKFHRVFPKADNVRWSGFSDEDEDCLKKRFADSVPLTDDDVALIQQLWSAYVKADNKTLRQLAQSDSRVLRFLPQVIEAQLARSHPDEHERQPMKLLKEIRAEGKESFEEIFYTFTQRAGVYGYGDAQIKKIYKD